MQFHHLSRAVQALVLWLALEAPDAVSAEGQCSQDGPQERPALSFMEHRPLPFDPMTLEAPLDDPWAALRDRRRLVAAVVHAVIDAGVLGWGDEKWMANVTDTLLQRRDLELDMAVGQYRSARVRLQVRPIRSRPSATLTITW